MSWGAGFWMGLVLAATVEAIWWLLVSSPERRRAAAAARRIGRLEGLRELAAVMDARAAQCRHAAVQRTRRGNAYTADLLRARAAAFEDAGERVRP